MEGKGKPQGEDVGQTELAKLRPSVLAVSRCFPDTNFQHNPYMKPNLLPHPQSAQGLQVGLPSALDGPCYKHVYNVDTSNRRTQGLPGCTNPSKSHERLKTSPGNV